MPGLPSNRMFQSTIYSTRIPTIIKCSTSLSHPGSVIPYNCFVGSSLPVSKNNICLWQHGRSCWWLYPEDCSTNRVWERVWVCQQDRGHSEKLVRFSCLRAWCRDVNLSWCSFLICSPTYPTIMATTHLHAPDDSRDQAFRCLWYQLLRHIKCNQSQKTQQTRGWLWTNKLSKSQRVAFHLPDSALIICHPASCCAPTRVTSNTSYNPTSRHPHYNCT